MREIHVWCVGDKFALSVDGVYQDIGSDADLLKKLLELEIPKDKAEDYIRRLKQAKQKIQIK